MKVFMDSEVIVYWINDRLVAEKALLGISQLENQDRIEIL